MGNPPKRLYLTSKCVTPKGKFYKSMEYNFIFRFQVHVALEQMKRLATLLCLLLTNYSAALSPLETTPFPCVLPKEKEKLPKILIYGETHYTPEAAETFHRLMAKAGKGEIVYANEAIVEHLGNNPLGLPAGISLEGTHSDFKNFVMNLTRLFTIRSYLEKGRMTSMSVPFFEPNEKNRDYVVGLILQNPPQLLFKQLIKDTNPFLAKNLDDFEQRMKAVRSNPVENAKLKDLLEKHILAEAKQLDQILLKQSIPGMPSIEAKIKEALPNIGKVKGITKELAFEWRDYFIAVSVAKLYCSALQHNRPLVN